MGVLGSTKAAIGGQYEPLSYAIESITNRTTTTLMQQGNHAERQPELP